jgi:pyruvate kinase
MRTKIVCTLGPSTDNDDVLRSMIRAGMDVARLNFSHGTHDDHARRMAQVRRLAAELGQAVAVMGDLQGPKFRIGDMPQAGIPIQPGETYVLFAGKTYDPTHPERIPFPHAEVLGALRPDNRLLIDDGALSMRVLEPESDAAVRCEVIDGGTLLSRKGVSAPGVAVAVSSITEKDRTDLAFICAQGLDAIALSFVRRAADVVELRQLIKQHGGQQLIVSKIEKPEAMRELLDILHASDAVMVARGDLGVEAPPEEVPFYQKRIIRNARRCGKPVITATQMLQSMVHEAVPTRAEASDVANAVLDGTDAVMLSAESATGEHPVAAVEAMARIATRAENHALRRHLWRHEAFEHGGHTEQQITDAVTTAAVAVAREIGAKAIVCGTRSGLTSRMVARHRPTVPVISLTTTERALHYAPFIWGVEGVIEPSVVQNTDAMFDAAERIVRGRGLAEDGDKIVIVAGVPLGSGAGMTNMIKVHVLKPA